MEENDSNKITLNDSGINEDIKTKNKKLGKKKKIIIISIVSIVCLVAIISIVLIVSKNKKGEVMPDDPDDEILDGTIIIEPKAGYHIQTIIWLHGLGNYPESFVNMFTKNISYPNKEKTRIVLLKAPLMNMTYSGEVYTSWFDIFNFPLNSENTYNFTDAESSSKILMNIIDQEAKLLNYQYDKIFIGGHSQGACISLYTGYKFKHLIGGVIVCSGILFPQGTIRNNKEKLNVYIGHGDKDQAIPIEFHKQTILPIENFEGVKKYYYPGHGHSISDQEHIDIGEFLTSIME